MSIPAAVSSEPTTPPCDHLLVRVGAERFALPLAAVDEAVEEPDAIVLPGAPGHCLGVLRWRERRVPLHDASPVFGLAAAVPPRVALVMGAREPVAVVVDELLDVATIAPGTVRAWSCREDPHRVVSGVTMIDGAPVAIVRAEAVSAALGSPSGAPDARADGARAVAA